MPEIDHDQLHIIAEAGTNHNADPATAHKLLAIAKDAGADSVKFQIIYPEGLYLPRFYDAETGYVENEVFEIRRQGMLDDGVYLDLAVAGRKEGIPVSASVFDSRGIALLDRMQAPYIKLASCDLNNGPLLRQALASGRKVILSSGMADLGEIEEAVRVADDAGGLEQLVLMHCVSVYPCPPRDSNVAMVGVLRAAFGLTVGYSDHTESNEAACVALALGARWFEKHFTYDRSAEGFDHHYALEPDMLTAYVARLHDLNLALRPAAEKVGDAEAATRERARRSVYAARDLPVGTILAETDFTIVRPEGPLRPNQAALLVGQALTRDVKAYEALRLDDVATA